MADALRCPVCGLLNPPDAQRCDCGHAFVVGAPRRPVDRNAKASSAATGVRAFAVPVLGLAGIGSLLVGLYFLVVAPGQPLPQNESQTQTTTPASSPPSLLAGGVVNLQRLSLGETFTICGVILIAAEWRPRR